MDNQSLADEAYAVTEATTALLFADDFASDEHTSKTYIQVSKESERFIATIKLERKKEVKKDETR